MLQMWLRKCVPQTLLMGVRVQPGSCSGLVPTVAAHAG